jgi:hypothetical protein
LAGGFTGKSSNYVYGEQQCRELRSRQRRQWQRSLQFRYNDLHHQPQLASGAPVTTCTNTANYSFNAMPDIIAKAAFEPGFGHYEVFGIFSRFRDRVYPCVEYLVPSTLCGTTGTASAVGAYNDSRNAGGVGRQRPRDHV